jgi:hypothetical protein
MRLDVRLPPSNESFYRNSPRVGGERTTRSNFHHKTPTHCGTTFLTVSLELGTPGNTVRRHSSFRLNDWRTTPAKVIGSHSGRRAYFAAASFAAAEEANMASSCSTAAASAMDCSACFHCFCSMASRTAGMAFAS